jgi:hypothetical protein
MADARASSSSSLLKVAIPVRILPQRTVENKAGDTARMAEGGFGGRAVSSLLLCR